MKTGNLIINWLLLSYALYRTKRLSSPFDKNIKAKGLQKSQFSNILVNREKFGSAAEALQKSQFFTTFTNWEKLESIHSPRPTFRNPNFEPMDELGKVIS